MLLVPARLQVLLLALGAAVEGDEAAAAGAVNRAAGDGTLRGTAVGAVADRRRGGGAVLFLVLLSMRMKI